MRAAASVFLSTPFIRDWVRLDQAVAMYPAGGSQGARRLPGCSPGIGTVSSCGTRPTATSGTGTVIEIGGECGVAPPCYLPAQRRVGRPERVAVEFGAGMVEARDATPDVARLRGVTFCRDRQVADNVDALAGGSVLEGYASCPD